jgi:hypothetical protein
LIFLTDFTSSIVQSVSLPETLAMDEGRHLLSYFFLVDSTLTKKIHVSIRVQIPNPTIFDVPFPKYVVYRYFRAWNDALIVDEADDDIGDSIDESFEIDGQSIQKICLCLPGVHLLVLNANEGCVPYV